MSDAEVFARPPHADAYARGITEGERRERHRIRELAVNFRSSYDGASFVDVEVAVEDWDDLIKLLADEPGERR